MRGVELAAMVLAIVSAAIGQHDRGAYFIALAIYLRLLRKDGGA